MRRSEIVADSIQLSAELRARLSYAMVKVQNGWQGLPIDEVESLASQAASPTSSTSTLHGRRRALASPRLALANIHNVSQSSDQGSQEQPTRTYESFWRQHSSGSQTSQNRHMGYARTAMSPVATQPSLAPAADIRSSAAMGSAYHSDRLARTPVLESLETRRGVFPVENSAPHTPNRGPTPGESVLRTPVQKSVQEQDAIETLMFMSSPGNPGLLNHSFPPSQSQTSQAQSPLRGDFGAPLRGANGRRVEFTGVGSADDSSDASPRAASLDRNQGQFHEVPQKRSDDELDRILDNMADHESSDDEIEVQTASKRIPVAEV